MTLSKHKNIHFVGIGGISMSGLAEILKSMGYNISGSDNKKSDRTKRLESIGIKVYIGHKSDNISENTDLIVYTNAVHEDNDELIEGKKRNIEIIDRAELLGTLMKEYKNPICIAGTHGKTTTTSMLSVIYLTADKNPTISLGGILSTINGNYKIGSNEFFIVESCEYCDSFLKFNPHCAVILNVDKDHIDYFSDINQIYDSFRKFALKIPEKGFLVINNDITNINKITDNLKCRVITFGTNNDAMWYPENIVVDHNGNYSYDACLNGKTIYKIKLNVPGKHNMLNSLSACCIAFEYNIEPRLVELGLYNFTGTDRRFEIKGKYNNAAIIDDYAHHPNEIISTIEAAKQHHINNLWCVFQPHTYSRTKALLDDFSKSFDKADYIILLDIYPAREIDTGEVHSKDLLSLLEKRNKNVYYFNNFEKAEEFIKSSLKEKDMLITMGAGDVYLIGESILKQ